jgi:hypothetical protein
LNKEESMARKQTAGERFKASLGKDFEPPDGVQQIVLDQLVRLLDEVEEMQAILDRDGLTATGGNQQVVVHPLVAASRQHAIAVSRLASQLGLGEETKGTRAARHAANARWGRR